jgi:hypothetical protein
MYNQRVLPFLRRRNLDIKYNFGIYVFAFNDYFHHLPKAIAGNDGDSISFWSDFIQDKPFNYFGKPVY